MKIYQALTTQMIALIRAGTLRCGERAPSVRQLARERGASAGTVAHAYELLQAQGIAIHGVDLLDKYITTGKTGEQERQLFRGILITKAKNYEEKEGYASSCVRNLGIKFTTVVDKMDAQVELNYTGWPDRMYLVGRRLYQVVASGPRWWVEAKQARQVLDSFQVIEP